jgi:hypothetical protein
MRQLAASAKEQAKTLASELDTMARRNPLGALATRAVSNFVQTVPVNERLVLR